MKKVYIVFSLFLIICCFFSCADRNASHGNINIKKPAEGEFRGVWVCTVYRMDYPSAYTKNSNVLKKDIDNIVENAARLGFNSVIFQARPAADAFYKSNIFPWSRYLTGTEGQAPDNGFDPLEYIIERCHQSNLELHAWINPYRVTAQASDRLVSNHIALSKPEYTVDFEGKLYFNPGIEAVRKIIIKGIEEIVENYAVDGIHFDDYFYPGKNFNDTAAFLKYNKDFSDIENWRRNNNDLLIRETYEAVKRINSSVEFGVSPPGIWANKYYNILGSETNGYQAYYDVFADSLKWVKNGWLDYIVPQVYWHIGNKGADYSVLLNWWADTVKNTGVMLYMGMACYKADDTSYGTVWRGGDEIERQIVLNRNKAEVSGMVFFRYLDVLTKDGIREQAEAYFVSNETAPEKDADINDDKTKDEKFDKAQNNETQKGGTSDNDKKDESIENNSGLGISTVKIIIIAAVLSGLTILTIFLKRYYKRR